MNKGTHIKNGINYSGGGGSSTLPPIVNNRYLHTNNTTGDLEWAEIEISSNYENLSNKPSINDITLEGNMTYSDLELMSNTNPTASGTFDLDGDIIASGRITDGDGNSLSNLNGLVFLVNSSGILEITYDDGGE